MLAPDTFGDRPDDPHAAPVDLDALLGEAGLPERVIRELRGYAPGTGSDERTQTWRMS